MKWGVLMDLWLMLVTTKLGHLHMTRRRIERSVPRTYVLVRRRAEDEPELGRSKDLFETACSVSLGQCLVLA